VKKNLKFFHPFLFSLYPALFLYAYNINVFRESVLVIPLLLSLAFSVLVFLICLILIRKVEISTPISSFLVLVSLSYGRLREPIEGINLNLGNRFLIGPNEIILTAVFVSLVVFIFLVFKYKRFLKNINKVLIFLSLALFLIAVSNVAFLEIKLGRNFLSGFGKQNQTVQTKKSTSDLPDIYYFILDRYAGDKTLKSYGFDNSDFWNFLTGKGFYVASQSTSNYPRTFLSVASSLNIEYLDFLTQQTNGGGTSDESIVTPMIQNNKVIQFLKNKGYYYIHVGSDWDPTRSNPNANINFVLSSHYPFADEFTSGFLRTTIASTVLKKIFPEDKTAVSADEINNEHRSTVLYQFEVLNQLPKTKGPKFVFAHILIPHPPYVLDKNCQPLTETTIDSRSEKENYLNQLQCANKKMKATIEQILSKSKRQPIIILQADEGPVPIENPISSNLDWKDASNASLTEKFPILNAYLLPNVDKNSLYPSITPVNSFRLVLDTYFGANLPLLEDKNYIFQDNQNFYKFTEITKKLKKLLNL